MKQHNMMAIAAIITCVYSNVYAMSGNKPILIRTLSSFGSHLSRTDSTEVFKPQQHMPYIGQRTLLMQRTLSTTSSRLMSKPLSDERFKKTVWYQPNRAIAAVLIVGGAGVYATLKSNLTVLAKEKEEEEDYADLNAETKAFIAGSATTIEQKIMDGFDYFILKNMEWFNNPPKKSLSELANSKNLSPESVAKDKHLLNKAIYNLNHLARQNSMQARQDKIKATDEVKQFLKILVKRDPLSIDQAMHTMQSICDEHRQKKDRKYCMVAQDLMQYLNSLKPSLCNLWGRWL